MHIFVFKVLFIKVLVVLELKALRFDDFNDDTWPMIGLRFTNNRLMLGCLRITTMY